MTDKEKALIKDMGSEIVDKFIPDFIAAEEERLPDTYKALAKMFLEPMIPQLVAFLDAKLATIEAGL